MIDVRINSATPYDLSSLLDNFPELGTLYLNSNLLKVIPIFDDSFAKTNYGLTKIRFLKLNNNYITCFQTEVEKAFAELCLALHHCTWKVID